MSAANGRTAGSMRPAAVSNASRISRGDRVSFFTKENPSRYSRASEPAHLSSDVNALSVAPLCASIGSNGRHVPA